MTTVAAPTRREYTPEDLLAMPDGKRYELVGGELVERNMGWESSLVGGRLFRWLADHCEKQQLGHVVPADGGYQCFPDEPRKVRWPDVSFVRLDRMPARDIPRGHCPIPPDLAVEVVSPTDRFDDVIEKANEYFSVGVRQVWVVSPPSRFVLVLRADGTAARFREGQDLTGEDVVPGFRCRLSELFANLPPQPQPASAE